MCDLEVKRNISANAVDVGERLSFLFFIFLVISFFKMLIEVMWGVKLMKRASRDRGREDGVSNGRSTNNAVHASNAYLVYFCNRATCMARAHWLSRRRG